MSEHHLGEKLWQRCQAKASDILKEFFDNADAEDELVRDWMAERIFREQQETLEEVYREIDKELMAYYAHRLAQEDDCFQDPPDALEKVLEILRDRICADIEAQIEHEEQCAREQHEQPPEWAT